ncbi:MAG: hypothetical protein IMY72_06430, partial [Bacteroidetes bacterium]|nr:hypothetical protein [Bacteroidota bacterium]
MPKLDPLGTFARGLDKSLKAAAREARRAENARFREIERQRREVARESQRLERERIKTVKAQGKKQGLNFATQQTEKAQHLRQKLINLLSDYNFYKSAFNWLDFKSFLKFSENRPSPEYNKQKKELPQKPNKSEYEVKETLFLKLFPKFRLKRENKARELFKTNLQEWKSLKENY